MKNYFIKYSSTFIFIGAVLLGMYFLNIVPHRLRNSPDLWRWLFPLIFVIIGLASKFFLSDSNSENTISENSKALNDERAQEGQAEDK